MRSILNFQFSIIHCIPLLLFFSCCRQPEVRVKIARMEQSLFTVPVDSLPAYIPRLERQYGELFELWGSEIIYVGSPGDSAFVAGLTGFLLDPTMNMVYKRVMEVYPDLNDIEKGLSKAFSKYRKEFPERVIPSVYTLISGLNESMVTADTILAIALDKYLGQNEEMYFMMDLAAYLRQTMDRKYLLPDIVKAWLYSEFPYNVSASDDVLSAILYEGKIMYAMRQMLPQTPGNLLFGYTSDQMRWCRNNNAQMWKHLVENRMLYATDRLTINKLVGPAPFTSLFTRESPGRAAVWLGYQIINSYMKHNKTTLEALLLDNDYLQILTKARFKP